MTAFRGATATDAGRVRSSNQDLAFATEELLAVADGMGGHVGGEVAARIALDTLRHAFGEHRDPSGLIGATNEANRAVFELSTRDPQLRGMGTTLTAAAIVRAGRRLRLVVTNVGDSRAYLLSRASLSQLTEDHSLVEEMVRHGELTEAEAAVHPHRHVLTRALGIDRTVSVDSWELDPVPGSRLLLCSDGLTNEVSDRDIAEVLTSEQDPEAAATRLVELALEHGGSDNVTVVVADLDEALPDPAGPSTRARAAAAERAASRGVGDAGTRGRVERRRRDPAERVLSVRVVLFVLAFVGVLGGAAGTVGWYVRASYFVGVDQGRVAVFRGRPGGFLWFRPTVVYASSLPLSRVFPPNVPIVRSGMLEPSLAAAEQIVTDLGDEHHALALPSVDTSSALGVAGTTTSIPVATTTTVAKRSKSSPTTTAPGATRTTRPGATTATAAPTTSTVARTASTTTTTTTTTSTTTTTTTTTTLAPPTTAPTTAPPTTTTAQGAPPST